MSDEFIQNYLSDAIATFQGHKKMAERAIDQLSDEEFFTSIDTESNSIAVIIKHIAGNLHSRWTDFLKFKVHLEKYNPIMNLRFHMINSILGMR